VASRHPGLLHKGRGSLKLRRKRDRKAGKDREAIVVTEIPYQVNKARLIEQPLGW